MGMLDGKVVAVTGAGRGIGRCIAIDCAAAGAKVVVADFGVEMDGSAPTSDIAESVVETRKGVPILFFFNGTHPDYHRVSDSVDKIDAEKASRIVKMVFFLGLDVANAEERPQWNPASRASIVEPATP